MSALTILIALALAATTFSTSYGITSMATQTEAGHHGSNRWRFRRVDLRAVTVVLLIVAMMTSS